MCRLDDRISDRPPRGPASSGASAELQPAPNLPASQSVTPDGALPFLSASLLPFLTAIDNVFHNTKRAIVGLKETRWREWLLPIDFEKRESFAHACEAYSRILEQEKRPADRQALYAQLVESEEVPPDDRVDPEEYLAILAEAVTRRNGWKAILERCRDLPRRLNVAGGAGRCGSESRSPSRTRGSADPA